MGRHLSYVTSALLLAAALPVAARAETPPATEPTAAEPSVTWQDPVTGHHYLHLKTRRSFARAVAACDNRGWNLFHPGHLSADELARLRQSPVWASLTWGTRFAGDPGEVKETAVWTSSQLIRWRAMAEATWLRKLRVETKVREWTQEMEQGTFESGPTLETICMYRGPSWYRCRAQSICRGPRKSPYEAPTLETGYLEEGPTRESALERATKRGNHRLSGIYSDWQCKVEWTHCEELR